MLSADGLVVHVWDEDGQDIGDYHFNDLDGPQDLLRSLASAFAQAAGPGGGWRTKYTVQQSHSRIRQFFREIMKIAPGLESISDLTPTIWSQWRKFNESTNVWPGTLNTVRSTLHLIPELPPAVRVALRDPVPKPHTRTRLKPYSRSELRDITKAAWRVVDQAAQRIRSHVSELQAYLASIKAEDQITPLAAKRGKLLDTLARSGDLPRGKDGNIAPYANGVLLANERPMNPRNAIYLTADEVFAFMILFAALRGYNPDTIARLSTRHQRPDGGVDVAVVHNIDLVKPRSPENGGTSSDNLIGRSDRSAASLYQLAKELTDPARMTLMRIGQTTDRLLISRMNIPRPYNSPFRLSISRGPAARSWLEKRLVLGDDGKPLRVSLQRVRLTEQVLNRRPRLNTLDVHEDVYVKQDPAAAEAAIEPIVAGQTEALEHSQVLMKTRHWTSEQVAEAHKNPGRASRELGIPEHKLRTFLVGKLDTALTSCIDFDHSPHSEGGPCRASFLMCLACPNSIATPRHLPRLVCLHDALSGLASAVDGEVWTTDYAAHFERLTHLLRTSTTQEELDEARKQVRSDDKTLIEALLRRHLDA